MVRLEPRLLGTRVRHDLRTVGVLCGAGAVDEVVALLRGVAVVASVERIGTGYPAPGHGVAPSASERCAVRTLASSSYPRSKPIQRRPCFSATAPVVPEPKNGSS